MSNRLGNNGGRFYSTLNRPVLVECNFIVDQTNGNGLGIRSLKGANVKNVFMYTSASITGTVATSAAQITSIAQGTSALSIGMAVQGTGIPANTTITSILSSSSVGISATPTGNHSSETITYQAQGNPFSASTGAGFALIQLKDNYNRYCGGFSGFADGVTGSSAAINASSLTVGNPYIIASVGNTAAGAFTVAPVADSSGSLAGTYFVCFDQYGNTFVVWYQVNGVGSPPAGVSGTPVQISLATNASADTITTALSTAFSSLSTSLNPAGVYSFTCSGGGTATLTVTGTAANVQLPGGPYDGASPLATGGTFALTVYLTNLAAWQEVGLKPGIVPTVGGTFVATKTGYSTGGSSTGLAYSPAVSGISTIEVVGDPNQTLNPIPMGGSPNFGGWILVQFLAPTVNGSAYDTPMIPTAPANNATAGFSFYLEAGSTTIAGD